MAHTRVVLPSLGEGVFSARILCWFKKPGQKALKDEPLLEVSTDKVDLEVPCPENGYLREIITGPGTTVNVHDVIAIFTTSSSEKIPSSHQKEEASYRESSDCQIVNIEKPLFGASQLELPLGRANDPMVIPHSDPDQNDSLWHSPKSALSPRVRKAMKDLGFQPSHLSGVQGSGECGRVTARDFDDMERYIGDQSTEPLSASRQLIVERMTRSVQDHLHLTTFRSIDFTQAIIVKRGFKQSRQRVSVTAIILYAVSQVLAKHPLLRTSLIANQSVTHQGIHLGFVVAGTENLLVPVIHNADQLPLLEIAQRVEQLTEKAKKQKLSLSELSGGVFTVTNPGMFGCQSSTAVIYGQQSAIMSVGELTTKWLPKESPSVDELNFQQSISNREFFPRLYLTLGLTFDHRIIDGRDGGMFLRDLEYFLCHQLGPAP
ncbi:MAG: dihydrolipoamide acetyltransferase family protein [Proteobacteria bacterium]|nr:dihydrolipoamide acetyltransferase family protein [Pseudomonadota bacterium]